MKKQNLKSKISNMKGSKGITLVALIITIIVLLILAVVAISSVNNTGIVQYAQNSKVAYIDGRDEEDTTLQNYIDVLNHYKPTKDNTNPPEEEEISWLYDGDYYLFFIGNVKELDLTEENKIVKAYTLKSFDENTGKIEYGDIINVELTTDLCVECLGGTVQETIKIGKNLVHGDFLISSFGAPNLVFTEGITTIPSKLYEGYEFIKSITLPSSLTSIEYAAFRGCDGLTSIILPSNVSLIEREAFKDCTNLTSITIKKAEGTLDLSNSGLTQEQIDNIVWAPEE